MAGLRELCTAAPTPLPSAKHPQLLAHRFLTQPPHLRRPATLPLWLGGIRLHLLVVGRRRWVLARLWALHALIIVPPLSLHLVSSMHAKARAADSAPTHARHITHEPAPHTCGAHHAWTSAPLVHAHSTASNKKMPECVQMNKLHRVLSPPSGLMHPGGGARTVKRPSESGSLSPLHSYPPLLPQTQP